MALRKNSTITKKGHRAFTTKMSAVENIKFKFERHQRISEKLLQKKYEKKCVIRKVDMNKKGTVTKVYYGTTSNSPLVNSTQIDLDFNGKVMIENGKNDVAYEALICGMDTNYRMFPELTQVTCPSNSLQLRMTREGFYYKENERIRFTAPTNMEGWTFLPGASVWGPSDEKKSSKYFFANTKTNEQWWKVIDKLTGNAYEYFLSRKQAPKKILKNTSRLNLFGTTMEKFAQINLKDYHIVVVNVPFNAVSDLNEEVKAELKRKGIDFGENINDGKNYLLADLLADMLNITPEEACLFAVQNRENYLCTKCLGQNFLKHQMNQIKENVIKLYGVENVEIYGNVNGPCALIVDSDGAKMVNRTALRNNETIIDCYGLAIAKASPSRTSGQLIAKMLEKNYDGAVERLRELLKEAFQSMIQDAADGKFNPKLGVMNNTAAVLKSKAVTDEGYMWSTLREAVVFTKSALAEMKINLSSVYDHAMFDDIYVQSCGLIEHLLGIKDCGEYGVLIEVYSRDVLAVFAEEIEAIECNPELTDKEKEEALDALLSAVVIKYPSAGAEEYLGVRYLTEREWDARCAAKISYVKELKATGKIYDVLNLNPDKDEDVKFVEGLIQQVEEYVNQIPYGVTLFASYNFIKNKLAGMDVDYDAILAIFDSIKTILINREMRNILTYIDYFDLSEMVYDDAEDIKEVKFNFNK